MSRENEMVLGGYKKFSVFEIIRSKNLCYGPGLYSAKALLLRFWESKAFALLVPCSHLGKQPDMERRGVFLWACLNLSRNRIRGR